MRRRRTERIVTSVQRIHCLRNVNTHRTECLLMLVESLGIASCKREAIAIVDAAARDAARDRRQSRIVLIATKPVRLNRKCACADHGIGAYDLDPRRLAEYKDYA